MLSSASARHEHPGPLEGLHFWEAKSEDLGRILTQLDGKRIRSVTSLLEACESPYLPPFVALVASARKAHEEAADNARHLAPLRPYLQALHERDDFGRLSELFKPIFHLLLMVWRHSRFYNTPPALAVLVREICNDLIEQSRRFIDPETLFDSPPLDSVSRLEEALRVCSYFKGVYHEYRSKAGVECPSNPWRFQNAALFGRLDAFIERAYELRELCRTSAQFGKLVAKDGAPIDIGGDKGSALSAEVEGVHVDFVAALESWREACGENALEVDTGGIGCGVSVGGVPKPPMSNEKNSHSNKMKHPQPESVDPASPDPFSTGMSRFRETVSELEQRLGGILNAAFAQCATVRSACRLLDGFGELLERDWVQCDLESKQLSLIRRCGEELKQVQALFAMGRAGSAPGRFNAREGPPLHANMPPFAGALAWVQVAPYPPPFLTRAHPTHRLASLHVNPPRPTHTHPQGLLRRMQDPMEALRAVMDKLEEADEVRRV